MDCVLCLMQRNLSTVAQDPDKPGLLKPSWSESQKLMAEAGFLGKLENFNKDTITEEVSNVDYLFSWCLMIAINIPSTYVK